MRKVGHVQRYCIVGWVYALCACLYGCEESLKMSSRSSDQIPIVRQQHSGYASSSEQWARFLKCWKSAVDGDSGQNSSVLSHSKVHEQALPSVIEQINELERALGTALPASYRDFLALHESFRAARATAGSDESIGLFNPKSVTRLKVFDPSSVNLAIKYPIDSSDEKYFVYGQRQIGTSGRNRYWAEAIVVGKYGPDSFERIVLYPQVRTSDGEMEASLHFHASEFRATSFAELMRQLSYYEIAHPSLVPPYPQAQLKGTCAGLLALKNVWWD